MLLATFSSANTGVEPRAAAAIALDFKESRLEIFNFTPFQKNYCNFTLQFHKKIIINIIFYLNYIKSDHEKYIRKTKYSCDIKR